MKHLRITSLPAVIAGLDPAIHEAAHAITVARILDLRLIMDARVKPAHDEQAKSASPPLWPGKRREAPSSRPKARPSRLVWHGRASLSEIMTIICDICVGHS